MEEQRAFIVINPLNVSKFGMYLISKRALSNSQRNTQVSYYTSLMFVSIFKDNTKAGLDSDMWIVSASETNR